ncbi:hypothetical protein DRN73_07405 [Candidatus Pacearchaeota archaeon]|nr:MAG: hypothetical protein DRN73_07405 [Candidatus Pacearchaeota archaeon]
MNKLEEKVIQHIKKLGEFRLDLELWYKDQEFVKNGGRIYYAVDTDTIKLFSNPSNNTEYVRVFPEENKITEEILAYALGEYIFFHLSPDNPLLIIPPYDLEIEKVAYAIASRALKVIQSNISIFPEILEECFEKKDMNEVINCLEKDPLNVIFAQFGGKESPFVELDRIVKILEKLLHITKFIEKDTKWSFPILDETKKEDYKKLNELSSEWLKRLKKTKSEKKVSFVLKLMLKC